MSIASMAYPYTYLDDSLVIGGRSGAGTSSLFVSSFAQYPRGGSGISSVVEEGSYDELVARGGAFAELVRRQRIEGED